MTSQLVHKIEGAQVQLHKSVLKALETFTVETGLVVTDIRWDDSVALDQNGHTQAVKYHNVRSSLRTGV